MDWKERAIDLVFDYVKERINKIDKVEFKREDVFIVWLCKTLQNAKCLLSTTLPDGMYYEVTFDGDKKKIYFDVYEKFQNVQYDWDETE